MPQTLTLDEAYGGAPVMNSDFGAPGSTPEDRAAGINSDADLQLRDPGNPNPKVPVAKPQVKSAPQVLSLDEAYGGPKPPTNAEAADRAAKDEMVIGDIVLGFPAFLAKIGTRGALDLFFTATGEAHPMTKASQIIDKAMQAPWMQFMSKPIQFLTDVDPSGSALGAMTQKLSSGMQSASESAQAAYGGEGGQFAQRALDIGMAKGGDYVARGAQALKGGLGKPQVEPPTEPPPVAEPTPAPEPTPGTMFGKDAEWNAKNKAYALMQSGASVKTVLAAVKSNPLVGKALDDFMQRRSEVRGGPMKDTLQGEVLPPEEANLKQVAQEHPDPADFGATVDTAAQARIGQTTTRTAPPPEPPPEPSGPTAPAGTMPRGQEMTDALNAVVGGMRRRAGERRVEDTGVPEGVAQDRLVRQAMERRAAKAAAETPAETPPTVSGGNAPVVYSIGQIPPWARKQGGNIDPELADRLSKLALAGVAAPLGVLTKTANYTTELFKRLPQNRFEFGKDTITSVLNQKDITGAERDAFNGILADTPGDTITAKQLVDGFKVATQDFQLEKTTSNQHADYGLKGIGREQGYWSAEASGYTPNAQLPAITNLWRLPEHMEVSDANHFSDPRLYGWTRSFQEDGIPHVVELQSDLMQHAKGAVPEAQRGVLLEEASQLQKRIDANNAAMQPARDALRENRPLPMTTVDLNRMSTVTLSYETRLAEIKTALNATVISSQLSPIIKHWPRRLIRETLADAAKSDIPFVRFATADTVAKVEGWPADVTPTRIENLKRVAEQTGEANDPGFLKHLKAEEDKLAAGRVFTPEHQSIYDRYAKDITPYLRRLGGKDYTDPQGHTWLEVPTPKGPPTMYGRADPKLLVHIAAAGLGATLGMYFADDKYKGALLGAFGGLLISRINPREAVAYLKKAVQPDPRLRVNDIANVWDATVEGSRIIHDKLNRDIKALVPDPNRRAVISNWIEGDKTIKLNPNEMRAAKIAQDFFTQMKNAGFDSGVLKSARENYVTHIWEWGLQGKGKVEAALARRGTGMSPHSPYAKERSIATLAEGKKMGLTPRTEDIGEIVETYGNSMAQAIANKNFLDGLKAAKTPEGISLVMPVKDAPHTYGFINHPQLQGMRFHPDIIPSLEFMFDAPPGLGGRIVEAVNTSLKRLSVSFSLFHVKALVDVHLATLGNPLKVFGDVKGFATGTNMYLQELKNAGLGPDIKSAVDAGLRFSLEQKPPRIEDVGQGNTFYDAMGVLQKVMDKTIPYSGKAAEAFIKVNHAADTLTWARMHTGMKLTTFMAMKEKVIKNNAEAYAKNPEKVKLMSDAEAGQIAAGVTNDLYGGLNWRRVAEGVNNRVGRDLALWALKPSSRRILNVGMFALDWTVSTVKPWIGALKKGSGFPGIIKPRTEADLYRQYVARSLLYYAVIGDGLNLALSGHHLWENRDPTRIDLGNGQTMQWSKHTMEPIHWLTNPMQQFLNKMGILPRQVLEQATGVEYLTAHGTSPPMKGSRLQHLGKGLTPISVQQNFQAGSSSGMLGMLGMPVYGKTYNQRIEDKMQRRLDKLDPARREKAREEHMKNLQYRR